LSDEATAGEIASVLGLGEDVPGKQPWSTLLPLFWDVDASQMLSAAKNLAALGGGSTTQMMFGLHAGSVEQVAEITSSEPWRALQSTPAASGIHFAWPGFLLRLPYGERQGRVETFQFEEQLQHDVNSLNWGGGSLLTCLAVLKSLEHGESPVNPRTLEGLPLHMYQEHGKTELHPVCAVQLSQATATELRKQGVSPVIAYHEDDKAMVPGVFSMRGEPWPG
jgi:hypothetical protein